MKQERSFRAGRRFQLCSISLVWLTTSLLAISTTPALSSLTYMSFAFQCGGWKHTASITRRRHMILVSSRSCSSKCLLRGSQTTACTVIRRRHLPHNTPFISASVNSCMPAFGYILQGKLWCRTIRSSRQNSSDENDIVWIERSFGDNTKVGKNRFSFHRHVSSQRKQSTQASPFDDNALDRKKEIHDIGRHGWQRMDWEKLNRKIRHHVSPSDDALLAEHNYDVARTDQLLPTKTSLTNAMPSPVELVMVRDRMVYIKRDDLLRLQKSNVSGNKARKMFLLNEMDATEFPDCVVSYGGPQSNAMVALAAIVHAKNTELDSSPPFVHNVGEENDLDLQLLNRLDDANDDSTMFPISDKEQGSLLQFDAAASLDKASMKGRETSSFFSSQGSKEKQKRFVYYTKKLPRYLRKQPNGNLLRALSLGMDLVELSPLEYGEMFGGDFGGSPIPPPRLAPPIPDRSLWVPQGGACGMAVPGARLLAEEIVGFWEKQGRGRSLSVCVPGGTCTTALFLFRELNKLLRKKNEGVNTTKLDIQVVVIPCVGDDAYARRQMIGLDIETGGSGVDLPIVLQPLSNGNYGEARRKLGGYFVFGEPAVAILQAFQEMKDCSGVYLDLLYGAPAWSLLLQHWKTTPSTGIAPGSRGMKHTDIDCPIAGRQVMYVHSGGLEGISSQLTRYKHKGLVDSSEIQ